MIIGLVGFIGCGKDTAAELLIENYGFQHISFAASLKDAVAAVFGWNRNLLEGKTAESRAWRDTVDEWWSNRLKIPNLTPRWVLQHWGTDILRDKFHQDIWIASLENRLIKSNANTVISDVRFPNEINAIKNAGGIIVWIRRGDLPEWYDCALRENTTHEDEQWLLEDAHQLMPQRYPNIHQSEWAWIGQTFHYEINNNGSLKDLSNQLSDLVQDHLASMGNLV